LTPDVEVPPSLARLRGLMQEVGMELAELCREGLPGEVSGRDLPALTAVLSLLTSQGWRPPRGSRIGLCALWEELARRAASDVERRRLLIAALEAAEGFDEVQRILAFLAALERSAAPPQENAGDTGVDPA
jgi:hypothetical protein